MSKIFKKSQGSKNLKHIPSLEITTEADEIMLELPSAGIRQELNKEDKAFKRLTVLSRTKMYDMQEKIALYLIK